MDEILRKFVRDAAEGIVIMDEAGKICYADASVDITETFRKQLHKRAARWKEQNISSRTWELTDATSKKYYRVVSLLVEHDGKSFFCSQLTDISDYAKLYQDIASYSRQMSDISDFQGSMLAKISAACELCLPELKYFCGSEEAVMYLENMRRNGVTRISFRSEMVKEALPLSEQAERFLEAARFDRIGDYHCLLSEQAADQRRYAVYLKDGETFNEEYFRGNSLYNVIRLFVENGILKEKIVYENEHDHLTGLYNKGKHIALTKDIFSHPKSLAVYNLDVNNLKYVNDNFGHEAGDDLIRLAARSIHAVETDNVLGFRMGGDEFAMIALNVSEQEADEIKERWQLALEQLNAEENTEVVIACGMAFGEGDYDLEALLTQADARMYADKRQLKGLA